jgi:hypothetical protein
VRTKYVPVYLVGIVVAASLVAGVCSLFALGVGFVAGYVNNIFENLPWLLSISVPSAGLLGTSIAWAAIKTRSDGARIVIVLVSTFLAIYLSLSFGNIILMAFERGPAQVNYNAFFRTAIKWSWVACLPGIPIGLITHACCRGMVTRINRRETRRVLREVEGREWA